MIVTVMSLAGVAQLVEQRIRNAKVVGSTPISGTIFRWSFQITQATEYSEDMGTTL